ncbi:MAG: hypothetical protein HHAS10_00820 [Candidatus Altimarinota bacterium]
MALSNFPDYSYDMLGPPLDTKKVEPPSLPSFMKEGVHESVEMNLAELRKTLIPTDEMARQIDRQSDPIGGIHGLKLVLSKTNNYKGKIDGNIDEGKNVGGSRINPLVKGLIDFQVSYNSPFRLGEDGRPLDKSSPGTEYKQGIPRNEIGKLGPVTLTVLLDFAKNNGLTLPPSRGDKKFENTGEFIQKYGPMVDYLTQALGLPKNLILGIAKQESNLGTNPNDYWGGNGVLQLTSAPLADMTGVTQNKSVIDWRKIGIYQNIFKKIDSKFLKTIPFGSVMNNVGSSLDDDAWSVVDTLCSGNTDPKSFREAMLKVQSWERGKFRGLTYHTLNILVGSAYLSYIQNYRLKGSQNVASIAQAYNGSGHKELYAQSVSRHVKSFSIAGRPNTKPQSNQTLLAQDDNLDNDVA